MAELKKTVLGKVSGAVGDIVFRERDGKNYIGLRPDSFIPGTDPASVARRERFALTLKAASSINAIPILKALWAEETPSGLSPFNYIFRVNYPYVSSGTISDLLKIVPGIGFGVSIVDSAVNSSGITFNIGAIGENAGIDLDVETDIMLAGVVFLSSPVDESVGAYSLLGTVSDKQSLSDLGMELNFSSYFTSQEQVIYNKYQTVKTFVSVVTLDTDKNPVHHAGTTVLN